MIELGVIDLSAESRRSLVALVERWTWVTSDALHTALPKISLHPVSPEELRFHGGLDACIVGPEILSTDAAFLRVIRQQLPDKIVIAVLDAKTYSFAMVEQLGRLGVDDVLLDSASSDEFFRRLLLLKRRVGQRSRGKIVVVDAARGGVGATMMTGALAEALLAPDRSVCVIDTDSASQDLTRFLQVKPCVNEPFKLLLDHQRVLTAEAVRECAFPVWEDEDKLWCVPPPAASDETLLASGQACRTFASFVEVLQSIFEVVVIDASPLIAPARHVLYTIADQVVFVMSRDPAGSFANRQALMVIGGAVRPEVSLKVAVMHNGSNAAPLSLLKENVVNVDGRSIEVVAFPFSQRAARWPCSGQTAYKVFSKLCRELVSAPEIKGRPERVVEAVPLGAGIAQRFGESLRRGCAKVVEGLSRMRRRFHGTAQQGGVGEAPAAVVSPVLISQPVQGSDGANADGGIELVSKPVIAR